MRNLAIILSAYALEEYVQPCLSPWKNFNIPIACASFQFENFQKQNNKPCLDELSKFIPDSHIFHSNENIVNEHNARNVPLEFLKQNTDTDTFLILDIDEFYAEKEIESLLNFINGDDFSWVAWAKINFKNYIFDEKSWIDDFCPPRLFKKTYQNYIIDKFYWDNDILYSDKDGTPVDYKQLSSIIIPKNNIHAKHMTWLNNERSKNKIEYQEAHFGACSYSWNALKNCVEINKDFYKKSGQLPPIIYNDTYA